MDPLEIIRKYYPENSKAYPILIDHSRLVADKAMQLAVNHPELNLDLKFVEEAAMLHDIGIYLTNAPDIGCYGTHPYLRHGYLGSAIIHKEGFPKHALVCERHTGTGLTKEDLVKLEFPITPRDMRPISLEEQLICFSDKFYSKSHPGKEKSVDKVRASMEKYGEHHIRRFDSWCEMFL